MTVARAVGLSLLVVTGAGSVAAQTEETAETTPMPRVARTGLPPLECVRQVREARITWGAAGAESALAALGRAAEVCPGHLEPLLEAGPSADVRWAVAEIDLASRRWESAIEQLEAVAAQEPEMADSARRLLVPAYAAAGRFEDVVRVVAELERGDGVWSVGSVVVGTVLEAAWAARDSGRHGNAERLFRKALELEPDNEHAAEALVNLYSGADARRQRAAQRNLELRQETDGDVLLEAGSRMNLGAALARLERCREALQVLDALVADHPEMWQAEYWRWWCLGREGMDEEAAEALARYEAGRSR